MVGRQEQRILIEYDHPGDWSPEKECCWRLAFSNLHGSHLQSQVITRSINHIFVRSTIYLVAAFVITNVLQLDSSILVGYPLSLS